MSTGVRMPPVIIACPEWAGEPGPCPGRLAARRGSNTVTTDVMTPGVSGTALSSSRSETKSRASVWRPR